MITFKSIKDHIILAIGGYPSLAPSQTREERFAEIVTLAGEHLFATPWKFRETTSRGISIVAGQNYVTLPSDIDEIISITSTSGSWGTTEFVTAEDIDSLRSGGTAAFAVSGATSVCITRSWDNGTLTPVPVGSALPPRRLEIYPTPTLTVANACAIRYRIAFPTVPPNSSDAFVFPIPQYVEALFISYCKAFAAAYETDSLSAHLAQVDISPMVDVARRKDGMQQSVYGVLKRSVNIRR